MNQTIEEKNKELVLKAFDTMFTSSTLTGLIQARSGLQCVPSNRDLTRVINCIFAR